MSVVTNTPHPETYDALLRVVQSLHFTLGIRPFEYMDVRLLVARPGSRLWPKTVKDVKEADQILADRMGDRGNRPPGVDAVHDVRLALQEEVGEIVPSHIKHPEKWLWDKLDHLHKAKVLHRSRSTKRGYRYLLNPDRVEHVKLRRYLADDSFSPRRLPGTSGDPLDEIKAGIPHPHVQGGVVVNAPGRIIGPDDEDFLAALRRTIFDLVELYARFYGQRRTKASERESFLLAFECQVPAALPTKKYERLTAQATEILQRREFASVLEPLDTS